MEFIPRIGFGDVRLGMSRDDVERLLGRPDRIEMCELDSGLESIQWIFEDLAVELDFDTDVEKRLARITGLGTDITVAGHKLVGMSEADLLKAFPQAKLTWEACGLRDFVDDKTDISFMVEGGAVSGVTLFPQYDESGQHAMWPGSR